jgi:hypothetical protein
MKKDMEKFGLVTSISDILAKAASSRPADNKSHDPKTFIKEEKGKIRF